MKKVTGPKSRKINESVQYKGYKIDDKDGNYKITPPQGAQWSEVAGTLATAKKWVDADLIDKKSKTNESVSTPKNGEYFELELEDGQKTTALDTSYATISALEKRLGSKLMKVDGQYTYGSGKTNEPVNESKKIVENPIQSFCELVGCKEADLISSWVDDKDDDKSAISSMIKDQDSPVEEMVQQDGDHKHTFHVYDIGGVKVLERLGMPDSMWWKKADHVKLIGLAVDHFKVDESADPKADISKWWDSTPVPVRSKLVKKFEMKKTSAESNYADQPDGGTLDIDNIFAEQSINEEGPKKSGKFDWSSTGWYKGEQYVVGNDPQTGKTAFGIWSDEKDEYILHHEMETHPALKKSTNESFSDEVYADIVTRLGDRPDKVATKAEIAKIITDGKLDTIQPEYLEKKLIDKGWKINESAPLLSVSESFGTRIAINDLDRADGVIDECLKKMEVEKYGNVTSGSIKTLKALIGDIMFDYKTRAVEKAGTWEDELADILGGDARPAIAAIEGVIKSMPTEVFESENVSERKMAKITMDGNDWYLSELDKTHVAVTNREGAVGEPYHIGQLRDKPFYSDVEKWLSDKEFDISGKKYGKINESLEWGKPGPNDNCEDHVKMCASDNWIYFFDIKQESLSIQNEDGNQLDVYNIKNEAEASTTIKALDKCKSWDELKAATSEYESEVISESQDSGVVSFKNHGVSKQEILDLLFEIAGIEPTEIQWTGDDGLDFSIPSNLAYDFLIEELANHEIAKV